jgi:Cof subfamily protein (haloacid dehalogenase superfamily)
MIIHPKLLLFDLDNTLLSSNKTISAANASAVKRCKSLGLNIGYITARSPRKVKAFLNDLPCDCIAYYNGASIYMGDNLLEKNDIPYETAIGTMLKIQEGYTHARIGAYLEPFSYFDGEIRNIITRETWAGKITDLPRHDIQRIRIVFSANDNRQLQQYMSSDMIYFITSDGTAIILNKNANKANALVKMADRFGILPSQVIAFGDDITDMDMIKVAGIGVAMGNAMDDLKQKADAITDTNDNDGVAKWINTNLLAISNASL